MESEITQPRLTSFSKASGCGCKIHPELLHQILEGRTANQHFPGLLVGNNHADDASVFQLSPTQAVVQTVDFFTPIVDDPAAFGAISAANAISDIYAMGAKPLMANAILGYPVDLLPVEVIRQVLAAAAEVCSQAGIPLAGGHSINIGELIFGLSVTGLVHPDLIKTNAGAKTGDLIYLTKPLGTGMIAAGYKRGLAEGDDEAILVRHCSRLNSVGAALGAVQGVHAMTDVTGFGFYGHLIEMCKAANLSAEVAFEKVPLLEAARRFADKFVLPDNTFRNWNAVKNEVECTNAKAFGWFNDPQTNGGLLIAAAPHAAGEIENILALANPEYPAKPIGRFVDAAEKRVIVVSGE